MPTKTIAMISWMFAGLVDGNNSTRETTTWNPWAFAGFTWLQHHCAIIIASSIIMVCPIFQWGTPRMMGFPAFMLFTCKLSCALLFDNYSVLQCSPPNSEGSQQFWSNITEIPSNPVIVHFGGLKTKLTGLPNNGEPHKGWPNLQHLDDCLNCIAHPQRSSRSKACTCWAAECSSSWHFTAREPDLRQ